MRTYICDNCGNAALAERHGADCDCGGTYSMSPRHVTTVMWLSRHKMTADQAESLRGIIGDEIEIISENVTWAASADGAADRVRNKAEWRLIYRRLTASGQRVAYVAGVFPPVALEALRRGRPRALRLLTPVSEQAPELRVGDGPIPFRHLRWVHL
mgnify:FL=1